MGAYADVQWQHGDEITSSKLQQMAWNDRWLKDNAYTGRLRFPTGTDGKFANGRTPGNFVATKIEASSRWLDSHTPVKLIDLGYAIPAIFSQPPVIFVTLETTFSDCCVRILVQDNEAVYVRLNTIDGLPARIAGNVNFLMIG